MNRTRRPSASAQKKAPAEAHAREQQHDRGEGAEQDDLQPGRALARPAVVALQQGGRARVERKGLLLAQSRRTLQNPGMAIPVTGVSELVLEVVDLAAAEAFYSGLLGLPVVERWPDRDAIWLMAGDRTRIGLWRPQVGLEQGRGGVHVHFAMHIAEADYDAAVAELRAKGAEVTEHTFGAYQHSRAAYVMDPDGHLVELWTWDVAGHLA
jgi:catechol 2,3-dioxygenase-like lactoylglutathione lyase family enzyme